MEPVVIDKSSFLYQLIAKMDVVSLWDIKNICDFRIAVLKSIGVLLFVICLVVIILAITGGVLGYVMASIVSLSFLPVTSYFVHTDAIALGLIIYGALFCSVAIALVSKFASWWLNECDEPNRKPKSVLYKLYKSWRDKVCYPVTFK